MRIGKKHIGKTVDIYLNDKMTALNDTITERLVNKIWEGLTNVDNKDRKKSLCKKNNSIN